MPEIPAALKPRLQAWWNTLDDGNHTIFEAIYLEAPAAVSRAISGGQWVADGPEPGLAAQLATDGGAADQARQQVPWITPAGEIEARPFHAGVGQPVQITWEEQNRASVDLQAYFTDVYVQDQQGNNVASARLTNAAIGAGEKAPRTWTFDGGASAGSYVVTIYMNSEGIDEGTGVPGPQGYRSASAVTFEVGAGEDQARGQDLGAWSAAQHALAAAAQAVPLSVAIDRLQEGLNWLAAFEQLEPQERGVVEQVAGYINGLGEEFRALLDEEPTPADGESPARHSFRVKVERVSGAAGTAYGYQAAGRRPLIEALHGFVAG